MSNMAAAFLSLKERVGVMLKVPCVVIWRIIQATPRPNGGVIRYGHEARVGNALNKISFVVEAALFGDSDEGIYVVNSA